MRNASSANHTSSSEATGPMRLGPLLPVALIALLVGVPLAGAVLTESISIPHNDAWSYSKIAAVFAETGTIQLLDWNRAALIGQFVVLGPLAKSVTVQQLFVVLMAAVGLAATYLVVKPRVGRSLALIAVVSVGITAEFALLSTSFMTDIPTYALMLTSLALLDQALKRTSSIWFAAALLAAVWATTIREQGLAALITIIIVGVSSWRGAQRWRAALLSTASAIAVAVFLAWRSSLPFADQLTVTISPGLTVKSMLLAVLTLGLFLAPVTLWVTNPRHWSRWGVVAALLMALIGLGWVSIRWSEPFLGNYVTQQGAYPTANFELGNAFAVAPWAWTLLVIVAVAGASVAIGQVVSQGVRLDRVMTWFGLLAGAVAIGPTLLGQEIFARGLLPLLPVGVVVLAPRVARVSTVWIKAAVVALIGVLWAIYLSIALHALAFDSARWNFAEAMVSSGWSPAQINAGIEWNGWHASGPYRPGQPNAECSTDPSARSRIIITPVEIDGRQSRLEWTYPTFGIFGESMLYAYDDPGCDS